MCSSRDRNALANTILGLRDPLCRVKDALPRLFSSEILGKVLCSQGHGHRVLKDCYHFRAAWHGCVGSNPAEKEGRGSKGAGRLTQSTGARPCGETRGSPKGIRMAGVSPCLALSPGSLFPAPSQTRGRARIKPQKLSARPQMPFCSAMAASLTTWCHPSRETLASPGTVPGPARLA